MNKKYIKNFVNEKYFDLPKGLIKSRLKTRNYNYIATTIELINPCIVVCNSTNEFDDFLIRRTIKTDYVVLKDSVVDQIHANTILEEDKKEIFENIKLLKSALISIVIFPENQISIFGRSQNLPMQVTEFLFECNMNLKFINFIDSYFVRPIWSTEFRTANTYLNSKFNLSPQFLNTLTPEERNSKINKCMPSSASVYGHKTNIHIKSNNLAKGLETLIFACPNCRELFSLSAQYNHLKCKNCMIPFECTHSGEIYTNGKTITFDEVEDFLTNYINNAKFSKQIAIYKNVSYNIHLHDLVVYKTENLDLELYEKKIKIIGLTNDTIINFKDVLNAELLPKNTLKLMLKSNEIISIKANNNENMYIIYALINKIKTQQ